MRPIWTGSISFGLVNIPIRLFSATSAESHLDLDMLHKKDFSPIRYAKICKAEEKEVPYEDVVKGFALENGEYVILTKEDFEKANPKKTKTIEILDFVDMEEIDPVYFEKPYFLEPDKSAGKAYMLLLEALKQSNKVGIARFVLKDKEHIAIIKPYEDALALIQIRYHGEMRGTKNLKIPEVELNEKELDLALQLIDQLTKKFNPQQYHDTYTEELRALIERKAKGKKIPKAPPPPKETKIHDIMGMLKASLEEKPEKKKKSRKKAA